MQRTSWVIDLTISSVTILEVRGHNCATAVGMVVLADKITLPDDIGSHRQDQLKDIEGDDEPESHLGEPMTSNYGFVPSVTAI